MNREDIIHVYEKANGWSPRDFDRTVDELERFTALVEDKFRERLADAIEQMPFGDTAQSFANYVRNFK